MHKRIRSVHRRGGVGRRRAAPLKSSAPLRRRSRALRQRSPDHLWEEDAITMVGENVNRTTQESFSTPPRGACPVLRRRWSRCLASPGPKFFGARGGVGDELRGRRIAPQRAMRSARAYGPVGGAGATIPTLAAMNACGVRGVRIVEPPHRWVPVFLRTLLTVSRNVINAGKMQGGMPPVGRVQGCVEHPCMRECRGAWCTPVGKSAGVRGALL